MSTYKNGLFLFHRDLRIIDNTTLNAMSNCENIYLIFIFDNVQLFGKNKYFSQPAFNFMIETLIELTQNINLNIFRGNSADIMVKLSRNMDVLGYNKDYTPFSIKRDNEINGAVKLVNTKIKIISQEDYLLFPAGKYRTTAGTIYTKFTPYWNECKRGKPIFTSEAHHKKFDNTRFHKISTDILKLCNLTAIEDLSEIMNIPSPTNLIGSPSMHGGRINALNALNNLYLQKDYAKSRDLLTHETTKLSAYIKFGCLSIREVYYAISTLPREAANILHKQLIWREFYTNLLYANPQLFGDIREFDESSPTHIGMSLKPSYENFPWEKNREVYKARFAAWCEGRTGFPIVDAAMRQLNLTGYMHNRGRLITSNFLIKLLRVDWRDGEHYFATKLIDYDPAVNNGNWQWSAGSGADSQPYFRIFNPELQSITHDPDAIYIKRWIPELTKIPIEHIHEWSVYYKSHPEYIAPIIDYDVAKTAYLRDATAHFKNRKE